MPKKEKKPKVKVGDRFDKLVAIEQIEMPIMTDKINEYGNRIKIPSGRTKIGWICKCDCGETIEISENTLLTQRASLRSCDKCPQEKNNNYKLPKMTFEDTQDWEELYEYVKTDIFGYDKNQLLPNIVTLRLKGLLVGKHYANNKVLNNANYSYKAILNTFKLCSQSIKNALKINNFKDEKHKVNYIFKIIENNINDVYIRMKNAEKSKEEAERFDISHTVNYVNTFKTKDKKKNNKLDELW